MPRVGGCASIAEMDHAELPTPHTHRTRLLLLAGLLLAFGLRLFRLGAESLWYDEAVSVYLASQPIADLVAHTARDIHPPGYYLLLHLWQGLATPTLAHGLEFLYSWPSLWFGMITVALAGAPAHRENSPLAAGIAVLLTAINPFQLMYAQEVRMYTMATTWTMLTWWATSAYLSAARSPTRHTGRFLGIYIAAAVAGLYTLYYFLFWLAILVPLVAFTLLPRQGRNTSVELRRWLLAQAVVLVAWLPWLPIFVRQAVNPPVPPWRTPWESPAGFAASLLEALASPLIGQSSPSPAVAPWAMLVVAITAAFVVYTKNKSGHDTVSSRMLPILLFGPVVLIFAVSLWLTPLYHVRYLVTYSVLFPIIIALLIVRLRRGSMVTGALVLLLTIIVSAASLANFWRAPQFRADDHRSAVASLAQAWRPGDAILVNAGWVYPVLAVYWPDLPGGPSKAAPPPIHAYPRLTAFLEEPTPFPAANADRISPVAIRSGSVDGSPTLGWGRPESDFFAVSTRDTLNALEAVAASHARLWHYRLYDTVSDPTGVIRTWIDTWGAPFADTVFPGPSYLRLQGITLAGPLPVMGAAVAQDTTFGPDVRLRQAHVPSTVHAGSYLYTVVIWDAITAAPSDPLSISLRLYTQEGALISQADTPLPSSHAPYTETLALPIPAVTAPGAYTLDLLVYRQADLSPIAAEPASNGAPAARLATVEITLP